jgi:hypothetical protein
VTSFVVSPWSVELEPEVEQWLESLSTNAFGAVAFQLDRLVEMGSLLRMPHSRALGDGLFELRFDSIAMRSGSPSSSRVATDRHVDDLPQAAIEREV